jgi:hypothetical protein
MACPQRVPTRGAPLIGFPQVENCSSALGARTPARTLNEPVMPAREHPSDATDRTDAARSTARRSRSPLARPAPCRIRPEPVVPFGARLDGFAGVVRSRRSVSRRPGPIADSRAVERVGWCLVMCARESAVLARRLRVAAGSAYRTGLNAARISVANSSGSSQAAKCPPLSTSLK